MTFLEQILRECLEKLPKEHFAFDTRAALGDISRLSPYHIDSIIQAILPAIEDFVCLMAEKPKAEFDRRNERS